MAGSAKLMHGMTLAQMLLAGDAHAGDVQTGRNALWYPSLQSFEHYNSGRSHVFSKATFGGSFKRRNGVATVSSPSSAYPSGYNMSYLDGSNAFIHGGSYGNYPNSIGPFVAKVNPWQQHDRPCRLP